MTMKYEIILQQFKFYAFYFMYGIDKELLLTICILNNYNRAYIYFNQVKMETKKKQL